MRLLVGLAIAGCSGMALLFAPLAGARADHGLGGHSHTSQPTPTQTAPTQTTQESQPPQASQPPQQTQQPQSADGRQGRSHGQHSHQGGRHDREAGKQQGADEQQAGGEQEDAGEQQAGAGQQPTAARPDVRRGGSGRGHDGAALRTRHHRAASRETHKSEGAAVVATATTTAPTPATVATPAVVTPQATIPPQAVSAAPPAVAAVKRQPTRRVRHASAPGKRPDAKPLASLAGALASATALSEPARLLHTQQPSTAAHRIASAARSSPLTRKITKIVSVVPVPVRVLIGLLLALAVTMGLRTRLAAARTKRLERQREQLLEDVGLLQTALLPVLPARVGPVATSAAYRPAAGPGAGGDFYDVFALEDGRIAIILGDVSGHGREALPHTALVRFTLRAYLEAGLSPRGAVQTAGDVLERQLGESFATVVVATYQPRERTLVYSCAGHPPPVVLGSQASATALVSVTACSAPPLGVGRRTGTRQTVLSLPGRARLCFHTDGVTEARVGSELFGETRLVEALAGLGTRAMASELLDRVAEQADRRPDDMAACVLSLEGASNEPRVLMEELELDREEAASGRTEDFLLACGVRPNDVADVVREARDAAGSAGSVILQLRLGDGAPEVSVQRDNLTYLPARRASRQAAMGVSR